MARLDMPTSEPWGADKAGPGTYEKQRHGRGFYAGVLLIIVPLAGCSGSSKTQTVTGTVKLENGKPLAGGRILFQPMGESTQPARGTIAADGTFQLGTFSTGDGAVPGVHKVAIYPAVPEQAVNDPAAVARYMAAVDIRYQNIQTTPLEYTVKSDGSVNHFDIVVKPGGARGSLK